MLYGYSRGVRSARAIERACVEDVAFRMVAMMETPDHATIARFVARHEVALAGLFGQVLGLCAEAGLVRPGVVAIDQTKMAGNASRESTRDFGQVAREIVAEARATDQAEDERYGDQRGDELPEQLRTREGRAEFFGRARERRAAETPEDQQQGSEPEPVSAQEDRFGFDTERIVARHQGREGWTREAHRQLEQHRWKQGDAVLADVKTGCCSSASGWRPSATPRSRPTGPMRSTGRPGATPTAGGSVADRSRGRRRRSLMGW